jgi:hypothetical protein
LGLPWDASRGRPYRSGGHSLKPVRGPLRSAFAPDVQGPRLAGILHPLELRSAPAHGEYLPLVPFLLPAVDGWTPNLLPLSESIAHCQLVSDKKTIGKGRRPSLSNGGTIRSWPHCFEGPEIVPTCLLCFGKA